MVSLVCLLVEAPFSFEIRPLEQESIVSGEQKGRGRKQCRTLGIKWWVVPFLCPHPPTPGPISWLREKQYHRLDTDLECMGHSKDSCPHATKHCQPPLLWVFKGYVTAVKPAASEQEHDSSWLLRLWGCDFPFMWFQLSSVEKLVWDF